MSYLETECQPSKLFFVCLTFFDLFQSCHFLPTVVNFYDQSIYLPGKMYYHQCFCGAFPY